MKTFWSCRPDWLYPPQTCDASGEYDHTGGGESGAAHAHTKKTGHPTTTSTRCWTPALPNDTEVEVWFAGGGL